MQALQQSIYWKVQQACGHRWGACLAAAPVFASLVPSALSGGARVGCLFPSFPIILLGFVVVRSPCPLQCGEV